MQRDLEEYKARAIILGMWYGSKAHAFFKYKDDPDTGYHEVEAVYDADTLEPIGRKELAVRVREGDQREREQREANARGASG